MNGQLHISKPSCTCGGHAMNIGPWWINWSMRFLGTLLFSYCRCYDFGLSSFMPWIHLIFGHQKEWGKPGEKPQRPGFWNLWTAELGTAVATLILAVDPNQPLCEPLYTDLLILQTKLILNWHGCLQGMMVTSGRGRHRSPRAFLQDRTLEKACWPWMPLENIREQRENSTQADCHICPYSKMSLRHGLLIWCKPGCMSLWGLVLLELWLTIQVYLEKAGTPL